MLVKSEVRTPQGNLFSLPLDDISAGYIVKEIEGLDPVKAVLVSTSFAGRSGQQFQSSRRESRNLVYKLGLDPDPSVDTVQDLRNKLYDFFIPESEVRLRFYMSDGLTVNIEGRVEDCVSPMFTREPSMDILITCFNPDFYDPTPVVVNGLSTAGEVPTAINYRGTQSSGFKFVIKPTVALPEFTIYHTLPNGDLRSLEFTQAPLAPGDVLTISTVPGSKGATLLRSGSESSVLYGVSPQSKWLQLTRGVNQFRVYSKVTGVPYSVQYTTKYGGL